MYYATEQERMIMKQEKAEKNDIGSKIDSDISELKNKISELTLGWQRTQADFVNYKKQSLEERQKLIQTANENLIYDLLPILDNFQLAAKHIPKELENNNWTQGIKQIEKQLENTLANEGLEKIELIGMEFDPQIHEAIEEVDSDLGEGVVAEEVLAGYMFHGDIIRPAKVKVSKGK